MLDFTKNPDFKHRGDSVGVDSNYDIDVQLKRSDLRGADAIDQSIENLIMTEKGERLFNLDFGSPIHDVLFENNTNVEAIKEYIYDEVEKWIPITIDRGYETIEVNHSNHVLYIWFRYSTNDGSIINHDFKRKFSI